MLDIRSIVREILLEELALHGTMPSAENNFESVPINNDDQINAFAIKVINLSQNRDLKTEIESGKIRFHLANKKEDGSGYLNDAKTTTTTDSIILSKKLITENDIYKLTDNVSYIHIGKTSCLTPLAKDEIRRKGIKIVRKEQ